jgi:predicted dithiol-disulfide oxidoreductase (DUF899 family)
MKQQRASKKTESHPVVSHDKWVKARTAFLAKEKEFTRKRDELAKQRRALPWEKVEKNYVFDGPQGKESLADLFAGKSQLIVYHFIFTPDWSEGCPSCSFWADNFNGIPIHLKHRDVSFVAISRAPLSKLQAFRKRMGWDFKWLSSGSNDFNYDLGVSFRPEDIAKGKVVYNYEKDPGMKMADRDAQALLQNAKEIFHTYSAYARGIDLMKPRTTTSTSLPKAVTRRFSSGRRVQCAITTDTTTDGIRRRNGRHEQPSSAPTAIARS